MNLSSSSSPDQKTSMNNAYATNNPNESSPPNCLLLLPPFSSSPFNFTRQSSNVVNNPPRIQLLAVATSQAMGHLQRSIASTADKWVTQLHILASRNPFIHRLLSFSSHVRTSSQISFRNHRDLVNLSRHNFAAVLPGDSVAGLVAANGILNFFNIYNSLLVVRLVLTWFPNAPPAIVSPLSTLCDPYLNIFRGIIPPLGGTLDLSPILAFLVLNAFTSAASALPAELPSAGESPDDSFHTPGSRATATQKKWIRRLTAKRKSSGLEN